MDIGSSEGDAKAVERVELSSNEAADSRGLTAWL